MQMGDAHQLVHDSLARRRRSAPFLDSASQTSPSSLERRAAACCWLELCAASVAAAAAANVLMTVAR